MAKFSTWHVCEFHWVFPGKTIKWMVETESLSSIQGPVSHVLHETTGYCPILCLFLIDSLSANTFYF